jgi:hypothetical protein
VQGNGCSNNLPLLGVEHELIVDIVHQSFGLGNSVIALPVSTYDKSSHFRKNIFFLFLKTAANRIYMLEIE